MMMSADNTDDNGYPFLKASDGSLDFGKITEIINGFGEIPKPFFSTKKHNMIYYFISLR